MDTDRTAPTHPTQTDPAGSEPAWLVECVAQGEPDATEDEARATLVAVFGPEWSDCWLGCEDEEAGLWLAPVPQAVADAVRAGSEWGTTVAVVDADGSESLHSVLVPVWG